MKLSWNKKQKEAMSDFFRNVAVGWLTAAFTLPYVLTPYDFLTQIKYLVSMGFALYISLHFLEDAYDNY
ncbi:MAG: hypothetical protein HYT10_01335 [Candidatus Levybacteria bacterium]|nr:hypothetical protein [Candidatus Levybacteria bacterium]